MRACICVLFSDSLANHPLGGVGENGEWGMVSIEKVRNKGMEFPFRANAFASPLT